MRKTWSVIAVLLAVGGFGLLAALLAEAAPVPTTLPAAAAKTSDKWEYCEIHYRYLPARANRGGFGGAGGPAGGGAPGGRGGRGGAGGPGAPGGAGVMVRPAQTMIRLGTSEDEIEVTSWEDLATKVKAAAAKKGAKENTHKLRALNAMGADGWELVTYQGRELSSSADVWTFKRKVRK